ncbi:MAG: CHAT domain-containing protein [Spirochaetales bacterium]|nr:CHAT domain-containing protein [Spirochaetales bacterium]
MIKNKTEEQSSNHNFSPVNAFQFPHRSESYVPLKKEIAYYWNRNKDYAFTLYDKLLIYQKRERKGYREKERNLIIQTGETVACSLSMTPELRDNYFSEEVVGYLKECVDSCRWQDNEKSMVYAKAIIFIGETRGDNSQTALGLMALGDSLAIGGENLEKAWEIQQQGADLFLKDGNLIGWARTTIGRVAISIELQCMEGALKEAYKALEIFKRYDQQVFFVRLSLNMMRLSGEKGQYAESLELFKSAYQTAINLKEKGKQDLGLLYINAGISHMHLGEFNKAYEYFSLAYDILTRLNKKEVLIHIINSIATIENIRGNYNEALRLWNEILLDSEGKNTTHIIRFKIQMAECYLNLNRDEEAREYVCTLIRDIMSLGETYIIYLAHGYRCLGMAEAKLGYYEKAQESLEKARDFFISLKSDTWTWYSDLLRGKIYVKQGNYQQACKIARDAALFFKKNRQPVNFARACLLKAECFIRERKYKKAAISGKALLQIGKLKGIAHFLYSAEIILGQVEEALGNIPLSKEHYRKALEMIEELQKNLTITIRPEFLEDKCEGFHALARVLLLENKVEEAFETVERLKSMTILNSLINRKQLFWSDKEPESRSLLEELHLLRKDYFCLYKINQESSLLKEDELAIHPSLLSEKLKTYEKKIRHIIERLYLINAKYNLCIPVKLPGIKDIQGSMPENSCIVEYYSDGEYISVFIVTGKTIDFCRLSVSIKEIRKLLTNYYQNISYALQEGTGTPVAGNLIRLGNSIGYKLYHTLVEPISLYLEKDKKLLIVPFGLLHYIPFNILYTGKNYFIEEREITILPLAGLLTRPCQPRNPGMVILAHTNNGKLSHIKHETEEIGRIFDSMCYIDKEARQKYMEREPLQILHIAAHGRHRIDKPDLSYILLEDGYLYADDLLQKNLDYELVTFSACETGKTVVKKSEEMIGLIRGVLYAGAQSMIVSMWCVDDKMTTQLMLHFYTLLKEGRSKADSLRQAQLQLIKSRPEIHPAFWGAFQLVGFPGPLSGNNQASTALNSVQHSCIE